MPLTKKVRKFVRIKVNFYLISIISLIVQKQKLINYKMKS